MPIRITILQSSDRPRSWADFERALPDAEGAAAIAFFRARFGEDWPAGDAPFADSFPTPFQQGPVEGVRLHRMIMALNGTPNLEVVVAGLGSDSWAQHVSDAMALEFCSRLQAAHYGAEFVRRDNRQKRPDARVRLSQRWIDVEFKALHDSDDHDLWVDLELEVMSEPTVDGVELGSLDIAFYPAAFTNPASVAAGLRAVYDSRSREYRELPDGTGRARFNGRNTGSREWPIAQQMEDSGRISGYMHKWSQQLAEAVGPTILVVKSKDIFPGALLRGNVLGATDQVCTDLLPALSRTPGIGALLIYEEPFLPVPPSHSATTARARVTVGASAGGQARVAMLIPNPAARVALQPDEFTPLVGEEMGW